MHKHTNTHTHTDDDFVSRLFAPKVAVKKQPELSRLTEFGRCYRWQHLMHFNMELIEIPIIAN